MMGININDSRQGFTALILDGQKTLETRNTDSLRPYVGKRVGIIRTGKGPATLVGFMTIGEPIIYINREHWQEDQDLHRVEAGSKYDFKVIKYGYRLSQVEPCEPQVITSRGIVARRITPNL